MQSKLAIIIVVAFVPVVMASAFQEREIIIDTSTVMALQAFETPANGSDYYEEKNRIDFEDQNEDGHRQADDDADGKKKKEPDNRTDQDQQHEGEADDIDRDKEKHKEQDNRHDVHWRYYGINGPGNWSFLHERCGVNNYNRSRQSPINIETQKTTFDELLMEISFIVDRIQHDRVTIVNTGHSVNFAYNRTTIRLAGGGLGHTYRVDGAHFHWGSDSSTGSEHQIDGKSFPLEMHVVSYDEDSYDSLQAAASADGDGIAVLSVLFRISEQDNYLFSPVVSNLRHVREPGASVVVDYFDLTNLLPSNPKDFFRYDGSLTTPPCYENVVWTVFASTQTISTEQLFEFRSLYEGGRETANSMDRQLLFNWRPVQPIGERKVQRSFSLPRLNFSMKTASPQSDHNRWIKDDGYRSLNGAAKIILTEHYYSSLLLISAFTSLFSA